MKLLLDTRVLLWWLDDNPALPNPAKDIIADGRNAVLVSVVVIWEIRIKQALGKLSVPADFRQVLDLQPFESLSITEDHAHALAGLPMHHRDPFDRMLVAQASTDVLTLVTHDVRLKQYGIRLLCV
jgi:PIN domain nuclease of toxin-antitoxin system